MIGSSIYFVFVLLWVLWVDLLVHRSEELLDH
jgi:hypothetical protein